MNVDARCWEGCLKGKRKGRLLFYDFHSGGGGGSAVSGRKSNRFGGSGTRARRRGMHFAGGASNQSTD